MPGTARATVAPHAVYTQIALLGEAMRMAIPGEVG